MSQDAWIGRTINERYEIESLLGKGGMSAVYKATDPNLRRAVAIKLIHTHLSDNPEFVRRFEEEAAAVARLRHPNIIQVHDFDHQGEVYFIVFEYIPGETLQERLRRLSAAGERIPLADTLQIISSMASALAYAHEMGLVHRDIKPANIMLNKREAAILMDFGIAKISDASVHTATGMVMGTARYMSPEQVMGETIDERTDIYALGVTLFEMVNGRPPFEADSVAALMMKHVNEPLPDLRELRPDVPADLVTVIDKSLAKKRDDRYQTAADFEADLGVVLEIVLSGMTTRKNALIAGQVDTRPSMAADVTILEKADFAPSSTAVSAAPAATSGNNRLLLIGGAILAFILIAACAIFAISTLRGGPEQPAETTALSLDSADESNAASLAAVADVNAPATAAAALSSEDTPVPVTGEAPEAQAVQVSGESSEKTTTAADQLADVAKEEADIVDAPAAAAEADFDPLFLTSYTYDGLIIGLALPSNDTERVLFSIDDPEPKIDNGRSSSGTLTLANNSIGPIPHDKGEHTLYIQYVGADGDTSEIYSFDYKIDDIVFNFTQQPYDFESEGIPALFTMFVVEGDTDALYTYAYSLDSETLDQSVAGVAEAGVVQLTGVEPGDHVLYVQATSSAGETGIVAYPFTIE